MNKVGPDRVPRNVTVSAACRTRSSSVIPPQCVENIRSDVEHCASQAVALLREGGVAVGLRIGGELVVPPAAGDEQRRRLLGTLAVCGHPARANDAKESRA